MKAAAPGRCAPSVLRRSGGWTGAAAALLALAACGAGAENNAIAGEGEPVRRGSAPAGAAGPSAHAGPEPASSARPDPAADAAASARLANAAAAARRCGWLHNPTPGNWWLEDGDGTWVLATQGGRQADGMDEMPDMSAEGWQEVNGHYGYGCACLTLTADPATREVAAIAAPEAKPLAACRSDRTLPAP